MSMASKRAWVVTMNTNPRAPAGKFTVDLSIGPNPDLLKSLKKASGTLPATSAIR